MKIIDCKQGSSEWFAARCGVVTASEVDALVTPKWKIKEGAAADTYLFKKVAEKLLGYSSDQLQGVSAFAMDQGKIVETIARPWYAFTYDVNVETPGFCVSDCGRYGCSPDGLVGDDLGLEIKSPMPDNHVRYLINGKVPDDYLPQVHFSMLVTGRPEWEFVSYSRHLPALVIRVQRDDAIQAVLRQAVDGFIARMDAALSKIETLRAIDRAEQRATKQP